MKGILGSCTQGLFKYEIEMVQMSPEEIDKTMFERKARRRGSLQRLNKEMVNKLVKQGSLKNDSTMERMNSLEEKRLGKKYRHVR